MTRQILALPLFVVAVVAWVGSAGAQTVSTWTGNIDNTYVNNANWDINVSPQGFNAAARFSTIGVAFTTMSTCCIPGGLLQVNAWTFDGTTSYAAFDGPVQFGGAGANVTNTSTVNQSIANDLSGTAFLLQNGPGTLFLTGTNTYTGGTTISAGTLQIGNGFTTGSITGNVTNNAALVFNRSNSITYGGVISGLGTVSQNGTGTLILTGNNTYNGGTILNAGTLQLGHSNALGFGGLTVLGASTLALQDNIAATTNINLQANLTVDVTTGSGTLSGIISQTGGAFGLTKTGAGTLFLNAANTYSGGTTLTAGTVAIGNNASLGTGTVTLNGGTLANNVNGLVVNNAFAVNTTGGRIVVDNPVHTLTLNGAISDGNGLTGVLTKTGAGTLVLTGANTYSGGTALQQGTLQIQNNTALGSGTLNFTGNNGTLSYDNSISNLTVTNAINLDNGVAGSRLRVNSGTATHSGNITATGAFSDLTKVGSGEIILSGTNTYTGNTVIAEGILTVQNGAAISDLSFVRLLTFGTLNVANSETIGSLSGAVGSQVTIAAGQILTVGGDNTSPFAYAGQVTGGTLQTTGTGTLGLTGFANSITALNVASTGTGGLTISGGTTNVTFSTLISSGLLTVSNGATLNSTGFLSSIIGNAATGAAVVTGTNSTWNTNAGIQLGIFGGTGTLTAADGGLVNVTGSIELNNASTLNIGTGALAGTVVATQINVNDTSQVVANFTDTTTVAADIQGTGSLTKNGTGTLILTGFNTYDGGTTINAGTLQVGDGVAPTATIGGNINIAGSTAVLAIAKAIGTNLQLDGVISGPGSLRVDGPGGVLLNNNNTYTGATTINGGTLTTLVTNALSATTAMTIASGATFDLNNLDQRVGSLAGAGTVSLGTATLTVGGDNTSTTFSGVIQDTGGLTKIGTGTLILTGNNTYTGATTVNAGTLQIGTTATPGSIASNVTNNASLVFRGTSTVGFIGITNNSELRFFDNSNAGAAFITTAAGATTSFASTTGPANNNQITATTLFTTGSLLTGSNRLTVTANVFFDPGSTWAFGITPTSGARILANGAILFGGTLNITGTGGSFTFGTRYALLTTGPGTVTGTFSGLTFTGTTVNARNPHLEYDDNNVYLAFDPNSIRFLLPPNATINQINVADAVDRFVLGGGNLGEFAALFNLTQPNLLSALTQLSGENATGFSQAAFQAMAQFLGVMLDPTADFRGTSLNGAPIAFASVSNLPPEVAAAYAAAMPTKAPAAIRGSPWTVWGAATGGYNKVRGDAVVGSNDVTGRAYGFALGADYRLSPNTVLGFAISGGGTSWGLASALGDGRSDALHLGLYGAHRFAGSAYVSAALGYGHHWVDTDRRITLPAAAQYRADFGAHVFAGRLETGYRFAMQRFGVTPYAALQGVAVKAPAYNETLASGTGAFVLGYGSKSATTARTELGAWFDLGTLLGSNAMTFRARAAWAHNWFSDNAITATFLTLPGASFTVNGATPPRDVALLSVASDIVLRQNLLFSAKFDSEFGSRSQTYTGTAKIRYAW